MHKALYRGGQVLHALRPRIDAAAADFARAHLSAAEARLFLAMQRRDQRHALAVLRRLRAAGHAEPELLTAALLHDCGKGAVPVWLRVLYVAAPSIVNRLAAEGESGTRAAAYRLLNHAALGARLAEEAGAGPATVRLIAGQPLPEEKALADALRAADDES